MLIRVKVKVRNDHRSLTEDFETEDLHLHMDDLQIQNWVQKVLQSFNEPVDTVTIKATVEL